MDTPARAEAPPPLPRATIRLLQAKGLTLDEAVSLTAFMCGLPTAGLDWSFRQICQMLFLKRLYQLGHFRTEDGEPIEPH